MITNPRTMAIGFIMVFHLDNPTIVESKLIGYKGETIELSKPKLDAMREQMNKEFDKLWAYNTNGLVTLTS